MLMRKKACLQLLPRIVFVMWCFTFMVFGIYAMIVDVSLKSQPCGQTTHIWKYSLLNVVFCFLTTASFFLFPGGGEGARARAMVITIFYAGFGTWGSLLWLGLNSTCSSVLSNQYQALFTFHHMSVYHNFTLFALMLLHEAYLGANYLKIDYTLMAEIHKKPINHAFSGSVGANGQSANFGSGQPGGGMMQMPHGMSPPGMNPALGGAPDMAPDIINDYKDISNTVVKSPPGTLPKSEP